MAYCDHSQQGYHQHSVVHSQNSLGDHNQPTDRNQNELPQEICSDIGIQDDPNIDLLDFDTEGSVFKLSDCQNQSLQQHQRFFMFHVFYVFTFNILFILSDCIIYLYIF